jgi:hypothetical protein
MPNLTAGLTKKVGPLKAWQWGAILGGGILVYGVMKRKGLSLSGTSSTTGATAAGLYDAGTSVAGSGTSGGSDNGTAPQPINITITPAQPTPNPDVVPTPKGLQTDAAFLGSFYQRFIAREKAVGNTKAASMSINEWYDTKYLPGALQGRYGEVRANPFAMPAVGASAAATRKATSVATTKKESLPVTTTPRKLTTAAPVRSIGGTRTVAEKTASKRVLTPTIKKVK